MAIAATAAFAARTVLLEDHPVVGESLEALLRARGLEVVGRATTLRELLPFIHTRDPHVALVDIVLQGDGGAPTADTGIAALLELRRIAPALHTVALSGFATPELQERCAQAGARGFLSKLHATGDALIESIARVLAGGRAFPDAAPARRFHAVAISPREREVLLMLGEGADNLTIAVTLGIAERTVKAHVASLYRKVGVSSRVQLALLARDVAR